MSWSYWFVGRGLLLCHGDAGIDFIDVLVAYQRGLLVDGGGDINADGEYR